MNTPSLNLEEKKVLVVGAGGIGCELLKNLAMTGFKNIEIVDMDTIDISNLNRQFLFTKDDVGKHKSECAAKAIKNRFPSIDITPYVGNIKDSQFDSDFFKRFDLVYNALDNIDARKHVNRVCISLNLPLIDGGSTGYIGTTVSIIKDKTPCYECIPKQTPKQFPVCTIRATPDKMVHCVVWAKYLLNVLFGDEGGVNFLEDFREELAELVEAGDSKALATKVFTKVFHDEIKSQLDLKDRKVEENKEELNPDEIKVVSMLKTKKLEPLDLSDLTKNFDTISYLDSDKLRKDTSIWTPDLYAKLFFDSISNILTHHSAQIGSLAFDKDDEDLLSFIISASCLRALNYKISLETGFEIKKIAGNIIPAISSTNAIVAGMETIEGLKILAGRIEELKATTYTSKNPLRPLTSTDITKEINKNCLICSKITPLYKLTVNKATFTLKDLLEKILKKELAICSPTIEYKGSLIYEVGDDLDEEETELYEAKLPKLLQEGLGLGDKSKIKIDDFLQNFLCDIEIHYLGEIDEEVNPEGYIFECLTGKVERNGEEGDEEGKEEGNGGKENLEEELSDDVVFVDHGNLDEKVAEKRKSGEIMDDDDDCDSRRAKTEF